MPDRKRNPRKVVFALDVLHLIAGVSIVVFAVLAFLSPEEHPSFFSAVFFLSAFLCLVNGVTGLRSAGRNTGKKLKGALRILSAVFLTAAGVVSILVMM